MIPNSISISIGEHSFSASFRLWLRFVIILGLYQTHFYTLRYAFPYKLLQGEGVILIILRLNMGSSENKAYGITLEANTLLRVQSWEI